MQQVESEFAKYNLTCEDVAKRLGYHPQYVRFLALKGKLPAIKRGRQWLFNETELMEKCRRDAQKAQGEGDGQGTSDSLLQ